MSLLLISTQPIYAEESRRFEKLTAVLPDETIWRGISCAGEPDAYELEAGILFTLKFDDAGHWKSIKAHQMSKRSSRKNDETVWRLRRNGCVSDQLWFEIGRKSQQKKHIEINEYESLKLKFIDLYPRGQRADVASWSSDSVVNSKRICRLRLFDLLAEI